MTDWSENPTKVAQIQTKIYMYIIGKLAKIRDVYGAEAYNKKEELRDQMLKLAKIHYATID